MADPRTETPADDTCSRCGSTFEHLHLFEGRPGQFCRDCAVELLNTKTEKTVADELREAAKTLRETAAKATRGPWARAAGLALDAREEAESGPNDIAHRHGEYLEWVALVGSGTTETADARWICLTDPLLAEPLASWLESAAWVAREHPQDPDYAGLPDTKFCTACNDEETTCVAFVDHALAVARVLNGGPS